jgi:ATP/maltotriose-dependent transcriptional regulator MalT/DNA-binding SARP family transcriptional activator
MSAVAVEPQILRTKLYPPRLLDIVARKRLVAELDRARSCKLISITAGAGYGKSTLAAEFLQKQGNPFVWYQLEETDSDVSVFLSYLIAGLKDLHPEFGDKTLEHMTSAGNVVQQSRSILATFITELDESVSEEFFIALDDFHVVNDSPQIAEAMDFLLGHMLPNLHLLVMTRSSLSLDLAHIRARRELLELSEEDLSFNTEETSNLFADVFGVTLDDGEASALFESTEGWVSGLVLYFLALKGKSGEELGMTIRESGLSPDVLFDYLSKAVYEDQPQDLREFIKRTSILSRLNPPFCDELLGISNSSKLLSHLVGRRLFTIPLDDRGEWYRYHSGLQAFLRQIVIEDLSGEELKELHLKSATLWEQNGEPEQALHHYIEAESHERAAEVLETISAQLIRESRISFVEQVMSRLPEEILDSHPRLAIQKAQIAAMFGDYDVAVSTAGKAGTAFKMSGDPDGEARSLLFSAGYHFSMADADEAAQLIARVREIASPSQDIYCEAIALESAISAGAGEDDRAKQLADDAIDRAGSIKAARMQARVFNWCGVAAFLQGRFHKALESFLDAERVLEAAGPSATRAFVYALLSRTYSFLDRHEEARETAEKGIALGESLGFTPMACLCHAVGAAASARAGGGEMALKDASTASSACVGQEAIGEVWYAHWFLGEAYALMGDDGPAIQHLKSFKQMAGKLPWVPPVSKLTMAACRSRQANLDKAIEETDEILQSLKDNGAGIAISLASSMLFILYSRLGEHEEALNILDGYIDDFGTDIILPACREDVDSVLPASTEAFSSGKHLELMNRVFSLDASGSITFLRQLEKSELPEVRAQAQELVERLSRESIEPLTIRMLGPLEIRLGDVSLPEKAWKSRKALTVLKYLAANRFAGFIPRDVVMELLWPDTLADSAAKNLNAALTALRKTLEPGAARGESSYVATHGDALRLELGAGGWIDVEVFKEKTSQAVKARELGDFDTYFGALKEAADLYRGEFLNEDPYEDWCREDRESFAKAYIKLLVDISTEYLRRGENEQALVYLDKAIAKDPGMEELYRKQMTINSVMGRRAGIEEAFRRCRDYLEENYAVQPSRETTDLYQNLRQD